MCQEVKCEKVYDIAYEYKCLEESQGFKIYYKTLNSNNEIVILSQIIPAGFSFEYSEDIPITIVGKMSKYLNSEKYLRWEIYDKDFSVNLDHITKIEIIDNAIDEIIKEM